MLAAWWRGKKLLFYKCPHEQFLKSAKFCHIPKIEKLQKPIRQHEAHYLPRGSRSLCYGTFNLSAIMG